MRIAPSLARWADLADGNVRRIAVAWGCSATGMSGVVLSGLFMLRAAPSGEGFAWSVAGIALVVCLFPALLSAQGPFWALHHRVQPAEARAISIAAVNSVGNIGGFVGPYLLAFLSDWLGPQCHSGQKCVRQWSWAFVSMGSSCLILVGLSARAAMLLLNPKPGCAHAQELEPM